MNASIKELQLKARFLTKQEAPINIQSNIPNITSSNLESYGVKKFCTILSPYCKQEQGY